MHSRERPLGGWSDIIDPDEEGGLGEEAKTDPHMIVGEDLAFDDPPTMRSPMPDFSTDPAAKAVKKVAAAPAPAPQRKLKLPVPGQQRERSSEAAVPLSFSLPADDEPPREKSPVTPQPAAHSPVFNSLDLVEKLGEPASAAPKKTSWRDYKEVIRTAIIGVLLIAGVVAYKLTRPEPPAEPKNAIVQTSTPAPPPPKHPNDPQQQQQQQPSQQPLVPEAPAATDPAKTTEPKVQKSATPMVTIISTPPGAMVEINGQPMKKTPLIMPIAIAAERLEVRLQLEKYKTWEGPVMPNEAGHFSLSVTLEKATTR